MTESGKERGKFLVVSDGNRFRTIGQAVCHAITTRQGICINDAAYEAVHTSYTNRVCAEIEAIRDRNRVGLANCTLILD